jgi:hypothetical protein
MVLRCPSGQHIDSFVFARWGQSVDQSGGLWRCWGPTSTPTSRCEADVTATVGPRCVGKPECNLSSVANAAALGGPCAAPVPGSDYGPQQLFVRVHCVSSSAETDRAPPLAVRMPVELDAHNGTVPWAVVNATVPGGSTGEIHVPLVDATKGTITESGIVVWQNGTFVAAAGAGVARGGSDGRFAWFTVHSGYYSFEAFPV